jgi:hypothetical protein
MQSVVDRNVVMRRMPVFQQRLSAPYRLGVQEAARLAHAAQRTTTTVVTLDDTAL